MLNSNMTKKIPMLKYWAGVGIDHSRMVIRTVNLGVIFIIPYAANKFCFTVSNCSNNNFIQAGLCQHDASLPSIVTAGAGRGTYINVNKDQKVEFELYGQAGYFFIAKANSVDQANVDNILITDLYCL